MTPQPYITPGTPNHNPNVDPDLPRGPDGTLWVVVVYSATDQLGASDVRHTWHQARDVAESKMRAWAMSVDQRLDQHGDTDMRWWVDSAIRRDLQQATPNQAWVRTFYSPLLNEARRFEILLAR